MTTRHLVDPELLPLLDALPPSEFSQENLAQIRQQFEAMATMAPAPPSDTQITERYAPGPAGSPDVRLVIYTPPGAHTQLPALLHIHGGGYVLGYPEMANARLQSLSTELQCLIVSVDYRLAPEHPFPAPVEDCYAGLKWLHDHAAELHVDPTKIAIGGESAGGGLAAALGLLARDREEISVAFQLLIYPMLDDRTGTTQDLNPHAGEFMWTRDANRFGWSALLGRAPGGDDVSCYAAPARAKTLSKLPPTFIAVGALDLFLEEDIAYAQRLMRAGVATELHVYPGAFHGFDLLPQASVSLQFERDFRNALRRIWG